MPEDPNSFKLPLQWRDLREASRKVRQQAYAPYSKYQVGAALLTGDGKIFSGCNVENASYGLTNCAERTAIFSAIREGNQSFCAVAIVADGHPLPYPCGACRQVMHEFCASDCPIYVAHPDRLDEFQQATLGELLPKAFGSEGGKSRQ